MSRATPEEHDLVAALAESQVPSHSSVFPIPCPLAPSASRYNDGETKHWTPISQ